MLKKIIGAYNNIEKWTLVVMAGLLVIVIFSQVFTRYIMGHALYWSEELGKFIFVWMSWLGVSAGLREGEHIQVRLLPDGLHKKGLYKTEKIVLIFISVAWFFTSIIVAYYGMHIVKGQLGTGVYGASTSIPMWIPYLCVPFSATIVCLRLLGEVYKDSMDLFRLIKGSEAEVVVK